MAISIAIDELGSSGAVNAGLAGITSGMDRYNTINRAISYLERLNGTGGIGANGLELKLGATFGTMKVTLTGAASINDTLTINGTAITAKASSTANNEFSLNATVETQAANMVTAINNSTTAAISGIVYASSSAGVLTLTCRHPGVVSGLMTLAISMSNATITQTPAAGIGTDSTNKHLNFP